MSKPTKKDGVHGTWSIMGIIKSQSDIRALKEAGRVTQSVLSALCESCIPGTSTLVLEQLANRLLSQHRSTAPFKSFDGFNHAICVSVNEEIVNGPPSRERILKEGDLVSIATAAEHRGLFGKAARTVYVGAHPSSEISGLLQAGRQVIEQAISRSTQVSTLNELLKVIPETAAQFGVSVIPDLGGSGIGKKLHDWPSVPNNPADLDENISLREGLCFTLMPMLSLGGSVPSVTHADGWTLLTGDGAVSAHVADTLLMTSGGLQNLTG